jgi:transposase
LLFNVIAKRLGLTELLKKHYPNNYREILALAYYEIMEGAVLYLFPYWLDEHYLPRVKKLYSPTISTLCDELGRSQEKRHLFNKEWINRLKPIKGIYYDITSISSYSTNIDFIEWGYNRDQESLPQLNMGVVFSQTHELPIYYQIYPGSIVDVTTLKNCIAYLNAFHLKNILVVLDRGFFSKTNIAELNKEANAITFIQPLPFRLKSVKALIRKNKKHLKGAPCAFKYNQEVLYYLREKLVVDDISFDTHMYFNEKAEVDQRHQLLLRLLDIEQKFENKKFETLKAYLRYKNENISEKYRPYFKWNKKTLFIEKNNKKLRSALMSMGFFLLMTNEQLLEKSVVLEYYRRKDSIEKIFDTVKNEMDGDRLRAHDNYINDGRLFINFLSLIIHTEIANIMRKKKLFEKYSLKELCLELKKIKITTIENQDPIVSELTKKHKTILEHFEIKQEDLLQHSY